MLVNNWFMRSILRMLPKNGLFYFTAYRQLHTDGGIANFRMASYRGVLKETEAYRWAVTNSCLIKKIFVLFLKNKLLRKPRYITPLRGL
jgi:hypothetical protein